MNLFLFRRTHQMAGRCSPIPLIVFIFVASAECNGCLKFISAKLVRMEDSPMKSFDEDLEVKVEAEKNVVERADSPEECLRPETPSSNASTSGVCSMASSDFESSEENVEDKPESQQEIPLDNPVIIYQKRNILDVFDNIYPFSIYQSTNVPKMNMSNYWERRSIYHRLGPYGHLEELHFHKCLFCDFYLTAPKTI